jgi:hypothetical protein
MKLELKHLAPYLPYGLKCKAFCEKQGELTKNYSSKKMTSLYAEKDGSVCIFISTTGYNSVRHNVKPVLRPLSDLTKEIEIDGEKIITIEFLENIACDLLDAASFYPIENEYRLSKINWLHESFLIVQKLIEWHFDVFGLIEKGLTIDINKI